MARRSFEVIDVVEVLQHWHAGRPKSVVAASVGVDPKTVRKYVAAAEAAGLSPGGEALSRGEWGALVATWFPGLVDARARQPTHTDIDRHRAEIKDMVATNTVTTVHQRLRDERGLAVGITAFRRYVAAEFPDEATRGLVTVLRPPVAPGEEAQIDYGFLGRWVDPAGHPRRVWAFVMVLACSRHMFVRPTLRLDAQSWVEAHVAAAEFFGGLPRRLVPDNLATGVAKADIYDPVINRTYGDFAAHHRVLVDPARLRKPKDKPRVERPMPYVRDSFWRGRSFADEAAMRAAALRWCTEVAGARHHRSLEGAAPLSVFRAVEAEALVPLPLMAFELAAWSRPKVGPDCHIKVGRALYSVPWRLIGQRVDARESARVVEVFVDAKVVKTWRRVERGKQTDWSDYPPEKVAFFMRTPVWCRRRSAELGPSVAAVVAELTTVHLLHKLRAAQGICGLADRHGAGRLDAACARALAVGDPSYRTIKGILVAGTEHDGEVTPSPPSAPAHLHGPDALFHPEHLGGFSRPDGTGETAGQGETVDQMAGIGVRS